MKKENKYLTDLIRGFEISDQKLIEETLWDFYHYFYEAIDTKDEDEYYEYLYDILEFLYKKIINNQIPNIEIHAQFDLINEDLLHFIVQPHWEKLRKKISPDILKKTSKNDPGETNDENLLSEMNYIAENIFYRHAYDYCNKEFIKKDMIEFIEKRMEELSNLILLGIVEASKNNNFNREMNIKDQLFGKKFRGNSLKKRKNDSENKYRKAAQILKVAERDHPTLKISQTIACEMAGCNSFSFARWKNYGKNFDIFLKWQNELTDEITEEIKSDIRAYYKLHSDM